MSNSNPPTDLPTRYRIEEPSGDSWIAWDCAALRKVSVFTAAPGAVDWDCLHRFADLHYPHVAIILDLAGTSSEGGWLVQQRCDGWSLAEILQEHGSRSAVVIDDRAQIILSAAETLAYCHAQGVAHGALTADCLVATGNGTHIVGWHRACQSSTVGADADVTALAHLLFQVLIGRSALRDPTAKRPDEKNDTGLIDLPDPEEMRLVSTGPLRLAIEILTTPASEDHVGMAAFAHRLHEMLHRPTHAATGGHALSPRWRSVGIAAMLTAAVLLGMLLFTNRDDWFRGPRIASVHTFTSGAWEHEWQRTAGEFQQIEDRLVSAGSQHNAVQLTQTLSVPVTIEVEAEMLKDYPAGDLTLIWHEKPMAPGDWLYVAPGYHLQAGGDDNHTIGIRRIPSGQYLDQLPRKLEIGRRYRLRAEIEADRLRLFIDDEMVSEYIPPIPLTQGYVGLLAYYPGKAFGPVRVTTTAPAARVSALAVGDALLRLGLLKDAANEYKTQADHQNNHDLAETARYREGLSWFLAERHADADAAWEQLPLGRWQLLAQCLQVQRWSLEGRHQAVCDRLQALAQHTEPALRSAVRGQWVESLRRLPERDESALLDNFLAIAQNTFANDPIVRSEAARACLRAGKLTLALEWSEGIPLVHSAMLAANGRPLEVLKLHADCIQDAARAGIQLGRFSETIASHPQIEWLVRAGSMMAGIHPTGKVDEAIAIPHEIAEGHAEAVLQSAKRLRPDLRLEALIALNRCDEALQYATTMEVRVPSDLALLTGQAEGLLASPLTDRRAWLTAGWFLWMEWVDAHDPRAADILDQLITKDIDQRWGELWFLQPVLVPLATGGRKGLLKHFEQIAAAGSEAGADAQRSWYFAAFVRGQIDQPTFLAQPARRQAPSLLLLAEGLRAECNGTFPDARAAYEAFLALPAWKRPVDDQLRQVLWESFATWRLHVLQLPLPTAP